MPNLGGIDQVATAANLAIVAGYLIVPVTALRLIPMSGWVRAAGAVFFATCATTHLYMALAPAGHHCVHSGGWLFWFMLANHLIQAMSVWAFVLGFADAVRHALSRPRRRRWAAPTAEVRRDRLPQSE